MQPDAKAVAEARALINCIQVTDDPTEQNRLWNRYYRLSDRVFPEVAALRTRYKQLGGEKRQRLKMEYMELVRTLWASFDPAAAYSRSFTAAEHTATSPPPLPVAEPQDTPGTGAPSRGRRVAALAVMVLLGGAAIAGWAYRPLPSDTSRRESAETAVPSASPDAPGPERAERAEGPERAEGATPAPTVATSPIKVPPLLADLSEAELDAELARTIQPKLRPVPKALRGKGDQARSDSKTYTDVYVVSGESNYYLRIPGEGRVVRLPVSGTEVVLGTDESVRKALLALWKENRAAIDGAEARREEEKQARLAVHFKKQERARERRAEALEKERWRSKSVDWVSLTTSQRSAARTRALSNWQAVQADLAAVEELYYRIVWGYQIIGISDSRANRLTTAYRHFASQLGPNFEIEDALIEYSFDREVAVQEIANWEREYYRLLEHVNEVYPAYEARVEELKRLDSMRPPALRQAEGTFNWDGPPDRSRMPVEPGGRGGGVGTGFIVADGYVMTCAHVVRGGSDIKATSTNGRTYTATIVTIDIANDWAVLEVEGLDGPPIPVAPEPPNVGATIYCLGYPLGGIQGSADPIVGSGNIAALQRFDGKPQYLQITAPVNPGNSGGPVVDQQGRWVGVVSQKLNDKATLEAAQTVTQGFNFAIKATAIEPILDPRAGVEFTAFTGDAATPMTLETIAKNIAPSIVRINVQ